MWRIKDLVQNTFIFILSSHLFQVQVQVQVLMSILLFRLPNPNNHASSMPTIKFFIVFYKKEKSINKKWSKYNYSNKMKQITKLAKDSNMTSRKAKGD